MSTPTLTTTTALWTAILFDLDGTITDSAPGITASLARTFETLGRPVPDAAELLAYVGPPLLDSFRERAGMSEEQAWEAIRAYRADYNGSAIDTSRRCATLVCRPAASSMRKRRVRTPRRMSNSWT